MSRTAAILLLPVLAAPLALSGCHVDANKGDGHDDVKIATPFGGLSVKTGKNSVASSTGLTLYPGATPAHDDDAKDKDAADVDMSFGGFHLGVKAASFRTADAPDKVMAFYRHDLARYGSVILCRQDKAVGTPTRTQDGLTCDKQGKSGGVHVGDDASLGELKAGSKRHQHVVAIDSDGAGTKFGLILLDLPENVETDSDSE